MKIKKLTLFFIIFAIFNLLVSLYLGDIESSAFFKDSTKTEYGQIYLALNSNTTKIYNETFFSKGIKFQYPPTSLVLFLPSKNTSFEIFNLIYNKISNRIFFVLSLIGLFVLFNKFLINKSDSRLDIALKNISFFILAITFYPLSKALSLGQIQVWINCLLIWAIVALTSKKNKIAGIVLGICSVIKPTYLITLVWGIVYKKKKFVYSSLAVIGGFFLASLIMYGLRNLIDYAKVLSFISKHGESFYPNQSFNGLINRLLFNGNNLEWVANAFPPFNKWVYLVTIITSIIILGTAIILPFYNKKNEGKVLAFLIFLLSLTIASPIAWEHHYGFIIAIYIIAASKIVYTLKSKNILVLLLLGSYILTSHFIHFLDVYFAKTYFNFLQSYLLFGALILLGLLYYIFIKDKALKIKSD